MPLLSGGDSMPRNETTAVSCRCRCNARRPGRGAAPCPCRGLPEKPIRQVVPFGAGGAGDLTARAIGQAPGQRLGQSVVVDNRPGAGGAIAGDAVAKAAPDSYTLLMMSNGTAASDSLFKRLPFDARKDCAPISPARPLRPRARRARRIEIRDCGRSSSTPAGSRQPGRLNLGTVNVGSTQHLAAELFRLSAQVELQVVPFNGTPAVITALRGGQIDAAVEILPPLMPHIQAQSTRVLAVLGEARSPPLPQVPTVAERVGLKGFNVSSWSALAAPAKTSAHIVARLARETRQVLESAEVKKQFADLSVQARASSPEPLAALLDSEIRRWSDVIAPAGIPRQ